MRAASAGYPVAREALRTYAMADLGWNARDAALLVEYASLETGANGHGGFANDELGFYPWRGGAHDSWVAGTFTTAELAWAATSCLGPLSAIGEQKATQLFATICPRGLRSMQARPMRRFSLPGAATCASKRSTWRLENSARANWTLPRPSRSTAMPANFQPSGMTGGRRPIPRSMPALTTSIQRPTSMQSKRRRAGRSSRTCR